MQNKEQTNENSSQFISWQLDDNTDIIQFSLTKCHQDLINRLKFNKLYTLEEAKILLKQIINVTTKNAEEDLKNLMFLSHFRTERLYPKPVISNWIDPNGKLSTKLAPSSHKPLNMGKEISDSSRRSTPHLGGFKLTNEQKELLRKKTFNGSTLLSQKENSKTYSINQSSKTTQSYVNNNSIEATDSIQNTSPKLDDNNFEKTLNINLNEQERNEDPLISNIQNNSNSIDTFIPMEQTKDKLESLVWRINQSLVKLIDSSLRQRRERLLLAATILEELESLPDIKLHLEDKYNFEQ